MTRFLDPRVVRSLSGWLAATVVAALLTTAAIAQEKKDATPSKTEKAESALEADPVFSKAVPASLEELKKIEARTQELVKKLQPCTVGLQIGRAQGSGVIVSKDGYILTAAHVSGKPGNDVTIILHDGRRIKGKSLGRNQAVDAGMIKITPTGDDVDREWPHAELAEFKSLKLGNWCVAMGHPGGFKTGRAPVVRLGRIVYIRNAVVQTDCALVGGDSGGPLFDMQGKVIGIHSRIGPAIHLNLHVPILAYSDGWDRLVKSDDWGQRPARGGAILGVNGDDNPKGAKVTAVPEGYPAAKAGLEVDDIITKLDGQPVKSFEWMAETIRKKKPGDKIKLEILRGEEVIEKEVVLAKRE